MTKMKQTAPYNLFDIQVCVTCGKPCHFGTGRFVNRYPVGHDDIEGFRCGDCAYEIDNLIDNEGG